MRGWVFRGDRGRGEHGVIMERGEVGGAWNEGNGKR